MILLKLGLRRLASLFLMVAALMALSPLMLLAIPGDHCAVILPDSASPADRELCHTQALTQIVFEQMGTSRLTGRPIWDDLAVHLRGTLQLTAVSYALSLSGGMGIGVLAAQYRHNLLGRWLNWSSIGFLSLPTLVLGFLFILCFAVWLNWLPITPTAGGGQNLLLPALTLILPLGAQVARVTRNALLDALDTQYIITVRAKGGSGWRVLYHAFRNAVATLLPFAGILLITLIDGVLLLENLFSRPGLGKHIFHAITKHDYPVVIAVMLTMLVATVLINFLVDILQYLLLPAHRDDLLKL